MLNDKRKLNLKKDYLPTPKFTNILIDDDEFDYEKGETLEDVLLRQTRISDVYNLIF